MIVEKRYQVFVSSTFQDLQEERKEVMQALLELDCIPAGMELFPAADENQWTLVREEIDHSDYYIVIIAGRYGTLGPSGNSYTEMEYRYALEAGKPVLAFLHRDPATLPVSKVDSDPSMQDRLRNFRILVQQKMCRFWASPTELGGLVSRSMVKVIKHSPGIGWIRADQLPPGNPLHELLEVRHRLESAEARLQETVEGASSMGLIRAGTSSIGLIRAIEHQGDFGSESDWLAILASAVERVDLMGRTLHGWTRSPDLADLVRRKILYDNVHFRWLVMSPMNPFLAILEEDHVNIAELLRQKLDAVLRFVTNIRNGLSESCRDLLEVRLIKVSPLYFGYLRVDDLFYVAPYLYSASSSSSPMLCLSNASAAWPRSYAREFETIWRLSPEASPNTAVQWTADAATDL